MKTENTQIGLTVTEVKELKNIAEIEIVCILSALQERTGMKVELVGTGLRGPKDGDKRLHIQLSTNPY